MLRVGNLTALMSPRLNESAVILYKPQHIVQKLYGVAIPSHHHCRVCLTRWRRIVSATKYRRGRRGLCSYCFLERKRCFQLNLNSSADSGLVRFWSQRTGETEDVSTMSASFSNIRTNPSYHPAGEIPALHPGWNISRLEIAVLLFSPVLCGSHNFQLPFLG